MKGYYLIYNTGCGLSAYTGNDTTPFYINDKAVIFKSKREALRILANLLNKWNLAREARRHFKVIPTTDSEIIINA